MTGKGQNRKTTAELKASGGYRKDRHGNRADTSPTPGEPNRPEGMTPGQAQVWDSVIASLPAAAIGAKDESALVELIHVYQLMLVCRELLADDPIDKNTRVSWAAYHDRWFKLAAEFGLTPKSRAAVKVPIGDDDPEEASDLAWLARFNDIV